jgi:hypothetical protein
VQLRLHVFSNDTSTNNNNRTEKERESGREMKNNNNNNNSKNIKATDEVKRRDSIERRRVRTNVAQNR